ncbi:hypothetical protein FRIGORI9N_400119 [Frigoribacterium sp. 9N]|nr:hypothetical protein FRIGORI9N_400119 [Frigoribacterium sp. 9N]
MWKWLVECRGRSLLKVVLTRWRITPLFQALYSKTALSNKRLSSPTKHNVLTITWGQPFSINARHPTCLN